MSESFQEHWLRTNHEKLLNEWAAGKNPPFTPDSIEVAGRRRIWWRCEKGHVWQASPDGRKKGEQCPFCSGRGLVPGTGDLMTLFPEIASEWHPTKNGAMTPKGVLPGSRVFVWWKCAQGHEWTASPRSRTLGNGCPYCEQRQSEPVGSLATDCPEIAKEWDISRNGALLPEAVSAQSAKSVWWRCVNGHEWKEPIRNRTESGDGCPVCSGKKLLRGYNDLATLFPNIAEEWAQENGRLTPADVVPSSSRMVWWECPQGHVWKASVAARVEDKCSCPFCAGRYLAKGQSDLKTRMPKIAAEWHPTKKGTLRPEDVRTSSPKKVWWICDMGHVWQASVKSRMEQNDPGCPICAARVTNETEKPA